MKKGEGEERNRKHTVVSIVTRNGLLLIGERRYFSVLSNPELLHIMMNEKKEEKRRKKEGN
jgi:hypothetical protein